MKKEIYDSMNDLERSPADYITLMFERTDEDGILYVPDLHCERSDKAVCYRCKMDWNLAKYENTLEKFKNLYAAIERCAAHWDELVEETEDGRKRDKWGDSPEVEAILGCEDAAVWNAYIRSLADKTLDADRYDEFKRVWKRSTSSDRSRRRSQKANRLTALKNRISRKILTPSSSTRKTRNLTTIISSGNFAMPKTASAPISAPGTSAFARGGFAV